MARAASVKWHFDDLDTFLRDIDGLTSQAVAGMSESLRDEAKRIMVRSEGEVPVDTGTLKGSGYVGIPHHVPGGMEIKFGYGPSPYALYQHYGTRYKHDDGKAMFLSDPFKWNRRGLTARIRTVLEKHFR